MSGWECRIHALQQMITRNNMSLEICLGRGFGGGAGYKRPPGGC